MTPAGGDAGPVPGPLAAPGRRPDASVRPADGADEAGAVVGIVLAAGSGSRLGGPKALVRFRGELLVERAARMLAAGGCAPVLVVLGAAADEVAAAARLGAARTVRAVDWAEGMGASLRAGLAAADGTGAGAAVVVLADQPLVGAQAVARLRGAWAAGATAAVATYGGMPRNPVLLARGVWADVAALARGDVGARAWLRAHPELVSPVPCDGTGDPADVDTPADLVALLEAAR